MPFSHLEAFLIFLIRSIAIVPGFILPDNISGTISSNKEGRRPFHCIILGS